MDRRLIGALLVVAVLAVAIIVPARDGLRIQGAPTMIALPEDPLVGDCLLEPDAEFWEGVRFPAFSAASLDQPENTRNPLAPMFGRCEGGSVAGEVVAIITAVGSPRARQIQIENSGLDCRASSLEYAGLVRIGERYSVPAEFAMDPVSWQFSINLRGVWVVPSALLQAAGRTWAACVVAPATTTRYAGVIAGAYRDGTLPAEFGTCWDRPESSAGIQSVACDEPHKAELVSTGRVLVRAETTTAEIGKSCEHLAAAVMRRTDPTGSGGLTVKVSPQISDSRPLRIPNLDIVCFVTPTEHSLAGTVVGLGDRPIPYTG